MTIQRKYIKSYAPTAFVVQQVGALVEHVEIAGSVLDCCGCAGDAISTMLTERGFRVSTNDLDPK